MPTSIAKIINQAADQKLAALINQENNALGIIAANVLGIEWPEIPGEIAI